MKKLFTYPIEYKGFPDYRAHSGQIVTIIKELVESVDGDYGGDKIFKVRADDGWTGSVWASELSDA